MDNDAFLTFLQKKNIKRSVKLNINNVTEAVKEKQSTEVLFLIKCKTHLL